MIDEHMNRVAKLVPIAVPPVPKPAIACPVCQNTAWYPRLLMGTHRTSSAWECGECHPEIITSKGYEFIPTEDIAALRREIGEMAREEEARWEYSDELDPQWPPSANVHKRLRLKDVPVEETPTQEPPTSRVWHEEKPGMFAVVDDTHLYCIQETDGNKKFARIAHEPIVTISQLFILLEEQGCITAWVTPESSLSTQTEAFLAASEEQWDILSQVDSEKNLMAAQGYRRSSNWEPTRYVVFPEYYDAWHPDNNNVALDRCTDSVQLFKALTYLENQVQVPLKQSSGAVGLTMLKKTHPAKVFFPTCENWELPLATDLQWRRKLTDEELQHLYLHCLDKNSAYLSICRGLYVGQGLPIEKVNPDLNLFSEKTAGIWHVTAIHGFSRCDGDMLPFPTHPFSKEDTGWYWTPTITILQALGYTLEVDRAFIWPRPLPVLENWAKEVWSCRDSLKSNAPGYKDALACQAAYEEMKVIATRTVGRLAMKGEYASSKKSPQTDYHPDWYSLVVDQTRSRMLWRMVKLQEQGYAPFMVYTDGLYITSNERDPHNIPALNLHTAPHLGGYKHAYTVRLSDVREAIHSTMENSDLLSLFKQHTLEQGEN